MRWELPLEVHYPVVRHSTREHTVATQTVHSNAQINFADYLRPDLQPREQTALWGIASGLARRQHLGYLPGLANRGLLRDAIDTLLSKGYIRRDARGDLHVEPMDATPLPECETRKRLAGKKVQRTLEFLVHPKRDLIVRGLAGVAELLDEAEVTELARMLRSLDHHALADQECSRRMKQSRLVWVLRRVPRELLDAEGLHPRPAVADLEGYLLDLLTRDGTPQQRDAVAASLRDLYPAVHDRGEVALAHWQRIAEAVPEEVADITKRWRRMAELLASYLSRHWKLPNQLEGYVLDRKDTQKRNPVPECGYGPWVEAEIDLLWRFRARFGPAVGPLLHALWAAAHQAMEEIVRTRREPGMRMGEDEYERRLFQEAERIANLGEPVVQALRAGRDEDPAVRVCRRNFERKWNRYLSRRWLRRLMHCARDAARIGTAETQPLPRTADRLLISRYPINLEGPKEQRWAAQLIQMMVQRRLARDVCADAEAKLEAYGCQQLGIRRRRRPHRQRVQQVVRWTLRTQEPVMVAEAEGQLPVQPLAARIAGALATVQSKVASDAELQIGARAVAEFFACRLSTEYVDANGEFEMCTLPAAAQRSGDLRGLYRVLDDSGLGTLLSLEELAGFFQLAPGAHVQQWRN